MNRKLKKDKKAQSQIKKKFHLKEKDKSKTLIMTSPLPSPHSIDQIENTPQPGQRLTLI